MNKVRVRFAPSPTGLLHVGNARTALFNWLFARQQQGCFILRIEDTDAARSAPQYAEKLVEDLRWLGLDWDEGPDVGGAFGPYRQSLRLDIYREHTRKLLDEGKAYHCFCSPDVLEQDRKQALAAGAMPIYNGRCRDLSPDEARKRLESGETAAVRLKTPTEGAVDVKDLIRGSMRFECSLIGDPVLVRSNGLPAYNYAVVIDDYLMGITHVIRGEDHISNTPRQILTYRAFDYAPPAFAHLSMVMGPDNTRLSKRHGATAISQFEEDGILDSSLFNYLALLGWAPPDEREVLTRDELEKAFELSRVSRSAAIFDYDKLHWLNRQHMRRLPPRRRAELALPFLVAKGWISPEPTESQWAWLEQAVDILIERVARFADLPDLFALFFEHSLEKVEDNVREVLGSNCGSRVVTLLAQKISKLSKFDYDIFAALTKEIKQESGCKGKELYHPLRLVLTARESGLDLDKFIPLAEEGARLDFVQSIKSCSQRVQESLKLTRSSPSSDG